MEERNYYENIPEDEFVPLDCVEDELKNKYEINKLGQIRIKDGGRILSIITKGVDYPKVILRNHKLGIKKLCFIHKLVALTFISNSNPNEKTQINHINLDRFDYSISNLEWISPSDNLRSRGEMKSWDRKMYVKLDESMNEVERIPRKNLTKNEKDAITSSIKNNKKYKGYFWKVIDTEVENYYSRFSKEELNNEIWKEAIGYPGIYISNLGLVKTSIGITVGHLIDSGYRTVNLNRGQHRRVHSLVVETFILGRKLVSPEVVDHINCDKTFNAVWNLKVCKDQKENLSNPNTYLKGRQKRVGKYDMNTGKLLKEYNSIIEAYKEFGGDYSCSGISCCCKGLRKSAYGFSWKYLE